MLNSKETRGLDNVSCEKMEFIRVDTSAEASPAEGAAVEALLAALPVVSRCLQVDYVCVVYLCVPVYSVPVCTCV